MKQTLAWIASGGVAGSLLAIAALASAGAGHGTIWSVVLSFGLLTELLARSPTESMWGPIESVYYMAIAGCFCVLIKRSRPWLAALVVGGHLASIGVSVIIFHESLFPDPLSYVQKAIHFVPFWFTVFGVVLVLTYITVASSLYRMWRQSRHGKLSSGHD